MGSDLFCCTQISLFQTDEKNKINMKLKSVKQGGESETNKTVLLFVSVCMSRQITAFINWKKKREKKGKKERKKVGRGVALDEILIRL